MTGVLIIAMMLAVLAAGFAAAVAKAFEVSSLARLEELAIARDKRATFDAILAGEEPACIYLPRPVKAVGGTMSRGHDRA